MTNYARPPAPGGGDVGLLTKLFTTATGRIALAAMAGAAAVVAGVTGLVILKYSPQPMHQAQRQSTPNITVENSTPDQFWSSMFTDIQRVEYAKSLLMQQSNDPEYPGMTIEQAAYKRLQAKLVSLGRSPMAPLVPPSITNTGNQAVMQQQAVTAAAIYIADSNMGEKLMAAETDDTHPGLSTLRENIRTKHKLSDAARLDDDFVAVYVPLHSQASADAGHDVEMMTAVVSNGRHIRDIPTVSGIPTRIVLVLNNMDMNIQIENIQTFVGDRWLISDWIKKESRQWIPPQDLPYVNAR